MNTVENRANNSYTFLTKQDLISRALMAFHDSESHKTLIQDILNDILIFFKASRTYIFNINQELSIQRYSYEACAKGVSPQIDIIGELPLSSTPYFYKKIITNEPFIVNNLEDIKFIAPSEYEVLKSQDILSILIYPIFVNTTLLSYIGIDITNEYRDWSSEDCSLLNTLANIISTSYSIGKKFAAKLKKVDDVAFERMAMLDAMYKNLPIGVVLTNPSGMVVSVNAKIPQIFNAKEEKLLKLNIFEDINIPKWAISDLEKGNDVNYELEYDFSYLSKKLNKKESNKNIFLSIRSSVIRNKQNKIIYYLLLFEDITERKKSEQELNKKTQLLETIFNTIPAGIELYDKNGKLYEINQFEIKQMGLNCKEDVIGYSLFDNPNIPIEIRNKLKNGHGSNFLLRYEFDKANFKTINTAISYLDVRTATINNIDGSDGFLFVVQDVTQDFTQRVKLENYKTKTNLIIEACNIVQWDYNIDKEFINTYSNEAIMPNVNMSVSEYLDFIHPLDRGIVLDMYNKIRNGDYCNITMEIRVLLPKRKDYSNVIINGVPIKNEKGKIYKYTGLRRDITEQVILNNELIDQKAKLEYSLSLLHNVIEKFPMGFFIKDIDDDFRYIVVNEQLKLLTGEKNSPIVGKTDYDVCPFEIAELFRKCNQEAVEANGKRVVSMVNIIINGKEFIRETTQSMFTSSDNRRLLIGIVSDVTDRENSSKELELAKQKAEQSDKLKSAFLANMSHEIRTPLNSIIGFSQLIKDSDNKAEKEEYFRIVSTNNDIMLRLINDILDLSKIEAGIIENNPEEFNLSEYFNDLTSSLSRRIKEPNIEYIIENPYSSCIVNSDKKCFTQVLTNFVTNAIKYTKIGFIKVGYCYENEGIKIYVQDSGIGIPDSKKPKVFGRFEKLDSFAQGTGLGLSICKALMDCCGGKIGFESEHNVGSTFWAWKPFKNIRIDK
ncbi:MAG: PAS domain S-box protein [Muribaculaceae bacterium]|nr:PAS domain S-box protein [Muribaculaceae bacterium]